jgi:hypothetical protein
MNSSTGAKLSTWRIPCERRAAVLPDVARPLGIALAITLLQSAIVLLLVLLSSASAPSEAYPALCKWDGQLYALIVRDGYRTTIPPTPLVDFEQSNVGFFPGYPLLAHSLRRMSGDWLSFKSSLVLAAQLSAWGFWTYWLLFLRRFRAPRQLAWLATLTVMLHPAAFYLVVAYSESLFLFAMLGFFYWLGDHQGRWGWALPHGIAMTATRLGGLPVALVPLMAQFMVEFSPVAQSLLASRHSANRWQPLRQTVHACSRQAWNDRHRNAQLAFVGAAACLGGLAFFVYCQWAFGHWDLYFWTQKEGATVTTDWIWWLRPSSYSFVGALIYDHLPWTDDLSRFCVALTVVLFVVLGRWEIRRSRALDQSLPQRLPFYLAALGLFFLHAAGVAPIAMQSMLRYSLVVHVLLLLAVAHACGQGMTPPWLNRANRRRFAIAFVLLACLQITLVWRFFTHQWVA